MDIPVETVKFPKIDVPPDKVQAPENPVKLTFRLVPFVLNVKVPAVMFKSKPLDVVRDVVVAVMAVDPPVIIFTVLEPVTVGPIV
jgi:hypothetical protein